MLKLFISTVTAFVLLAGITLVPVKEVGSKGMSAQEFEMIVTQVQYEYHAGNERLGEYIEPATDEKMEGLVNNE